MDHFWAPQGTKPMDIPKFDGEEYDNGPFKSYPKRKTPPRSARRILNGDTVSAEESSDDVVAFFQTWLFFGCLIKVFEAARVKVKTEDFIRVTDGKKLITTERLRKYIQDWRNLHHEVIDIEKSMQEYGNPDDPEGFFKVFVEQNAGEVAAEAAIKKILKEVDRVCRMCCIKETKRSFELVGSHENDVWSLPSEVALSILALRWTLSEAAFQIYTPEAIPEGDVWWESTALRRRMLEAGWCPSEVPWMMTSVRIDSQYYFGSLRSPRWEKDHTRCTERSIACRHAGGIQYSTKHTSQCQGCKNFKVSDEKAWIKIVERGGTPIISWKESEDGGGGQLHCVEYDPHSKATYVAISHVWSDGMGNEYENSLPRCQLSRLQKLIDQLNAIPQDHTKEDTYHFLGPIRAISTGGRIPEKPIGFWMDTICVPVSKKYARHRKSTIAKMNAIYEEADRVLALDSWVQEISSTSTLEEKAARLYLSNWQHRLWTCQEGVLANALYFQFSDRPQTIENLFEEAASAKESGSFYSAIPGLTLPVIPVFDLKFTSETLPAMHEKFRIVLMAVQHRITSKLTDETICIANLLNLNPKPLLDISEEKRLDKKMTEAELKAEKQRASKATQHKRMQKLMQMVEKFEQGFIFNKLPRLQDDGFRWAPASYLGHPAGSVYNPLNHQNLPMANLMETGGLLVTYPGMKLGLVGPHLGTSPVVVRVRPKGKLMFYKILLESDDNGKYPSWESRTYAVITSQTIRDKPVSEAILGTLDGEESVDGHSWSRLRHLCRVKVEPLEKEKVPEAKMQWDSHLQKEKEVEDEWEDVDEDCLVLGEWLPKSHRWCVL